jgi:hypothetical protein
MSTRGVQRVVLSKRSTPARRTALYSGPASNYKKSMRHTSAYARRASTAAALVLVIAQAILYANAQTAPEAQVVERGKFRIYKLQYPVGEESYEVRRDGEGLSMQSKFEINYLGDAVALSATLRTRPMCCSCAAI